MSIRLSRPLLQGSFTRQVTQSFYGKEATSCPWPLSYFHAPLSRLRNFHPTIVATTRVRTHVQSPTTTPQQRANMASESTKTPKEFPTPPSIEPLQEQLSSLGIADPLSVFPDSNPTTNPIDVYRCYIAHVLAPITGVDLALVYPALEWTQSFEKGDLILAAPRLRIKGRKPDELAKEWAEKVRTQPFLYPTRI